MKDFIVLVVLIWILCMMIGGRKAANGAVALIGGAVLYGLRFMGAIIAWMVQAVLIILLFLALYHFLRRLTGFPRPRHRRDYRQSGYNRYNPYDRDDLPPMPPL